MPTVNNSIIIIVSNSTVSVTIGDQSLIYARHFEIVSVAFLLCHITVVVAGVMGVTDNKTLFLAV